jgi:hypothetical protein
LGAAQVKGVPAQLPPVQTSVFVQALPSLHAVPSGTFKCWQPATESHVSVVQGLLSSQFGG